MKKLLPIVLILVVAGGLWFAISSRSPAPTGSTNTPAGSEVAQVGGNQAAPIDSGAPTFSGDAADAEDRDGTETFDERSAIERYKSADEALQALKAGASDYDDLVLDQFTNLGQNCAWCESFYKSVKDMMLSPDTKGDQKSYYAEVMAISGRKENIEALVEAIKGASKQEDADLFAEALELTSGKDDVVKYLGEQLTQSNETLKEASIAAITNQGTRLSVQLLHDSTVSAGDPDGFYSKGIGLGEVVPEPEAFPFLQEQMLKRDQYSHLAVKSLLNSGLDGLKMVMDSLASSSNATFDKEMLRGAKDHVTFDDEVVQYLRNIASSSQNPSVKEFAQDALKDFDQMESESEGENEEAPFTPMNP